MVSRSLSVFVVVCSLLFASLGVVSAQAQDLVVIQSVDATTLNPYFAQDVPGRNIIWNVFDALIRQDDNMEVKPWLATSWKQLNELEWEFTPTPRTHFPQRRTAQLPGGPIHL